MHQRRSVAHALVDAAALAVALAGCNALFGQDVRLSDDASVGGDAPDGSSTTPELCATPLPPCSPTAVPVVGDWDGNGTDTVGLHRGASFFLRNSNASGNADLVALYGNGGDRGVAGDWDGNGSSGIGVYR